jgi:mannose-1-phosphate guanylyltransferase/mannose-6-phosphate isomerase
MTAMSSPTGLAAHAATFDRWLRQDALPLWASRGFDEMGFVEALEPDGSPAHLPRRLRVQARQTWVFAQAGLIGWDGPWRARVEAGLDVLASRYRRSDGCYRTLLGPEGAILDDEDTLYDQAFVLLALAGASEAGAPGLAAEALELLAGPMARLSHPTGGYRETRGATPFQSNPLMHLLEAALAWEALAPGDPWSPLADGIAKLALGRLIDPATDLLHEFFAADWSRAPDPAGALIDPGHQFEWAWLLERWGLLRGRTDAQDAATRLFRAGQAGVDRRREVAVDMMPQGADPSAQGARTWPQTERLKAALILAARRDASEGDYLAEARAACGALDRYLDAPVPGLWREHMLPDGAFRLGVAPATTLYHLLCAILELEQRVATVGQIIP